MRISNVYLLLLSTIAVMAHVNAPIHAQDNQKILQIPSNDDFEGANQGCGCKNCHCSFTRPSGDKNKKIEIEINNETESESYITYIFNKLFPFGPAGNSILATTYISGPPNFILALIPSDIKVSSLSLLVSFAIGGLLGDVFLHLLPQTYLGQSVDLISGGDIYVKVDEKKSLVLGIGMFIGFLLFFIIDKGLRILEHTGEGEEGSFHSHSHSHASSDEPGDTAKSSSVETKDSSELKNRKKEVNDEKSLEFSSNEAIITNPSASVKTSAYLNLISDFTHNITDGLAIASSFYISKNVGCTTAIATFMHEIPHEVGDFALLIQGGFTKWQAMNSQFITAVGAYVGTFIGIALQSSFVDSKDTEGTVSGTLLEEIGIFGTSLKYSDLTLPFTAGGFLYISFSVIPELLEMEKGTSRKDEFIKMIMQLICIFVGIGLMVVIALNE